MGNANEQLDLPLLLRTGLLARGGVKRDTKSSILRPLSTLPQAVHVTVTSSTLFHPASLSVNFFRHSFGRISAQE